MGQSSSYPHPVGFEQSNPAVSQKSSYNGKNHIRIAVEFTNSPSLFLISRFSTKFSWNRLQIGENWYLRGVGVKSCVTQPLISVGLDPENKIIYSFYSFVDTSVLTNFTIFRHVTFHKGRCLPGSTDEPFIFPSLSMSYV